MINKQTIIIINKKYSQQAKKLRYIWVLEQSGKNFPQSGTLLDSSVPTLKRSKKDHKWS